MMIVFKDLYVGKGYLFVICFNKIRIINITFIVWVNRNIQLKKSQKIEQGNVLNVMT
jgi:hypothetical protein